MKKQNKDSKKKKKSSGDGGTTEKLNEKRRSSITGSVMDTSSSSSSSVESDEFEIFDRSSKKTLAAEEALSVASLSDNTAVLTACNMLRNDKCTKLECENLTETGLQKLTNGSRSKAEDNRRQTKKQTRRERRKKEKEKKSHEFLGNPVKGNCDKSALVQSLLNLRLTGNGEFAQKKKPPNPVTVSFGDFPDRSKNFLFGSTDSIRASKNLDVMEDNDVFHVYTTGNKLRKLLQCDESKGAISKFHVPIEDKVGTGQLGAPYEANYASTRSVRMDKLLKAEIAMEPKYTQWTKSFHNALVEGNQEAFQKKFDCLVKILKKAFFGIRYRCMGEQQCKERIMKGIVSYFSDQQGSYTVIHQLAATRSVERKCGINGEHSKCRMIKYVLGSLSWRDRRDLLRLQTQKSGKTALHLAAMTGQPCQIEVLMSFGKSFVLLITFLQFKLIRADPDVLDFARRAPLHYAVLSNDVYTTKMFLWYGADISLLERNCTPLQLASINQNTATVYEFLCARKDALEKFFVDWVSLFVRGVWSPYRTFTDLHFIKLYRGAYCPHNFMLSSDDKKRVISLNVRSSAKQSNENNKRSLPLLFVLPAFYSDSDYYSEDNNPQIYCTPIISDGAEDIVKLIQGSPILKGAAYPSVKLEPAFINPHNGYFYAYQLPRDLPTGTYSVTFNVDISKMSYKAKYMMLAVQGIVCGPPEYCIWNTAKAKGKSKVD